MLHRVSNTAVVHNTGVLFQEIPLLTHSLNIHCFCVIRYDEEQAQSENAERDLRSRSGQSLGSKGTKGSAGVRPTAATWKWSDNFSLKFTSCTTLQGPSVVNHLDLFFFLAHWTDAPSVQISLTVAQGAMALLLSGEKSAMCSHWEGWKACVCHCLYECKTK